MTNVQTRLERAWSAQQLVCIGRRIPRTNRVDGYILSLGKSWILLAALDGGIYLDGYIALRRRDIVEVKRKRDSDSFVRRVLELHNDWPPNLPVGVILDLANTQTLIDTAAKHFPLVVILTERLDPDICFIGAPTSVTQRTVYLHEVTSKAEWENRSNHHKLSDITRVDLAGRYETALYEIAGSPIG